MASQGKKLMNNPFGSTFRKWLGVTFKTVITEKTSTNKGKKKSTPSTNVIKTRTMSISTQQWNPKRYAFSTFVVSIPLYFIHLGSQDEKNLEVVEDVKNLQVVEDESASDEPASSLMATMASSLGCMVAKYGDKSTVITLLCLSIVGGGSILIYRYRNAKIAQGLREPGQLQLYQPQQIEKVSILPEKLSVQGAMLEAVIEAAANSLINLRESSNKWDREVGDGDCGSTMCRGTSAILEDMKKHYPLNDAVQTVYEIGCSLERAGGTSGSMYNIFFNAAYRKLKESRTVKPSITPKNWVDALETAIAAVTEYERTQAGRTTRKLSNAFNPALTVLQKKLNENCDPLKAFVLSAELMHAAVTGAETTKDAQDGLNVSAEVLWYKAAALAAKEKGKELFDLANSCMLWVDTVEQQELG